MRPVRRFLLALSLCAGCASGAADDTGLTDAGAKPPDADVDVCIDQDRDGHGQGAACRAADCDDADPRVNPSQVEVCDGKDNDCDGVPDEDLLAPDCALHLGVCAGARARCQAGAFAACNGVADYGPDYEAVETRCDALDNDCDGVADRDCPCDPGAARVCGQDQGECRPGEQQCVDGQWGPCVGETTPGDEVCNGKDDDCDGVADDDLADAPPDCALSQGVCAGARATCRGAEGYAPCGAAEYGDRWVAEESAADCDTLDNDCDGRTDEDCACGDGEQQACGLNVGACRPGTQTCENGVWGECRGATGPAEESCDGLDDDCDGQTDEGLPPLACPLQAGVCAGAAVDCADTGGRAECDADVYAAHSPRWVAVESDAQCDGLDNDCDGLTDEACQCVDGDAQVCGQNVGQCTQGRQVCAGGRFGPCDGVAATAEACDGVDNDCDGAVDEDAPTPACPLDQGVCAGASAVCTRGELAPCGAEAYGPAWQAAETFCDQRDNDCDGDTDEGCECVDNTVQACGSDTGACTRGMQTCVGGRWGPCEGEIPPVPEACNGLDDDCDATPDDALPAPPCPLQAGICAGAVQTCGGVVGWSGACDAAEYGPRWVAAETDQNCDGLDNDCDGRTDEACECQPDAPRPVCGSNTGECRTGELLCENGHFGRCEGEAAPSPERCNGLDDDCNAAVDDAVPPEGCALQAGVCAGRHKRCGGPAGFLDCTPDDYGPFYRADEGDLIGECDGRDNDCDGLVDERCPLPPVVISEVYYDSPGRDGGAEFIELSGPAGTPLNGLALVAYNGGNGQEYARIPLDGAVMPAIGAYLIVDDAATPLMRDIADRLHPDADLQNGPDSLRLVRNVDQVVDAVGYGRVDAAAGEVFLGEGMPAPDAAEQSLTRDALNTDTGDNAVDFQLSRDVAPGVPTPRGQAVPRIHVALRWDLDDTDLDLHLQREGAGLRDGIGDCYYANRRPIWVPDPPLGPSGPRLERDDTDGLGPEYIDFVAPGPGRYRVQVQYFSDRGHGDVTATVGVFLDGLEAATISRRLGRAAPAGPYWAVADLEVTAEGTLRVSAVDQVGEVAFPGP
jgi:hypothetical protein